MATSDVHGYAQLEDDSIDRAPCHRRRVWAVCCGVLSAGAAVVCLSLHSASHESTSAQMNAGENLAVLPVNSHLMQRTAPVAAAYMPRSMPKVFWQPSFRNGFHTSGQYSQLRGYYPLQQIYRQRTNAEADAEEAPAEEAPAEEAAAEGDAGADEEAAAKAEAEAAEKAKAEALAKEKAMEEALAKEREEYVAAQSEAMAAEAAALGAKQEASNAKRADIEAKKALLAQMEKKLASGKFSGSKYKGKRHLLKKKIELAQKEIAMYEGIVPNWAPADFHEDDPDDPFIITPAPAEVKEEETAEVEKEPAPAAEAK
eukprot:gnl/MRDRNA2_/MRDRNA2_106963_c0_seq1.p1 gnl/MRDRNA2_/MRDRNA2_106963_c0~~gnl/MRDRNA2_/MRDRNA2_106963_c0_seq1.p1  ORF type:complete len:314 (-),score=101.29 gnl/MRDRNA2_/MRDRNA2_106963_c0_seq1:80-1021(-)